MASKPSMNESRGTHLRHRSDIESLSPEVLAALQSTFGGRLSALRSQSSLKRNTVAIPSSPSPPRSRAEKVKPSVVTEPPPPPAVEEKESADTRKEGTYVAASYIAGILLSIFILFAADGTRDDAPCGGRVNGRCLRLYGILIPVGLFGLNLIIALVLFVFDVSFAVFNIITYVEKNVFQASGSVPPVQEWVLENILDIGTIVLSVILLWLARSSMLNPLLTFCEQGVKMFWMMGFTLMATAIFWCVMESVRDPPLMHVYKKGAAKTVIGVFLLFAAISLLYTSIAPPNEKLPCEAPIAAEINGTEDLQLQLYKGWLYEAAVSSAKAKQIQPYSDAHRHEACAGEEYHQCKARINVPQCDLSEMPGQCEAKYDQGMCQARFDQGMCEARSDQGICEARYDQGMCDARYDQGMCEAKYNRDICDAMYEEGFCDARYDKGPQMCEAKYAEECEWPWLKRIQVYERYDKCKYVLPSCDSPWLKRIQVYESKNVCQYHCPQCDWPLRKRIQVYARADRCAILKLPQCDWPFLKQLQRYEAKARCEGIERRQSEWPFLKQIQFYEPWSWYWLGRQIFGHKHLQWQFDRRPA